MVQKIDTDIATSNVALILLFIMFSLIFSALIKPSSTEKIQLLVNEMTESPARQQRALDKLSEYGEEGLICLYPYFRDERPIASKEVKFLNTSPMVSEKYFLTSGDNVGQVLIQYFCWRTMRCVVDSRSDIEKVRRQLDSDFNLQEEVDKSSGFSCHNKLIGRKVFSDTLKNN